jgi:predicted outer membrane repeat protein
VTVDQALYRNNSSGSDETTRPVSPEDVKTIENPLPVMPRYFFARRVVPVSNATEAVVKLFEGDRLNDVTDTSFVENFSGAPSYSSGGAISAKGSGDRVNLTVEPAAIDRFLIANELYYPGWSATVDGRAAQIYPTNAVMRGVVVPAGATTVDFTYTPFVRRNTSFAFYGAALLLAGVGAFVFGRLSLR